MKHTPGPWQIWSGPSYVGGGADICIGAGKTWLANMDRRCCKNLVAHQTAEPDYHGPCECEPDTDICSSSCSLEDHISDEQMANARLIAAAPELLEALQAFVNAEAMIAYGWGGNREAVLLHLYSKATQAILKATSSE